MTEIDRSTEARTFVLVAITAGFFAWELGFDVGAFETIDHRRFWAVWILCTIAFVASLLFRDAGFDLGGRWRAVLAVPTLWLVADFLLLDEDGLAATILLIVSIATLPFALYLLVHLLAGDFFVLTRPSRKGVTALVIGIFLAGLYVGVGHDRFITCDDFARAGYYVPQNCRP